MKTEEPKQAIEEPVVSLGVASPIILGITGHRHIKDEGFAKIEPSLLMTFKAFSSARGSGDEMHGNEIADLRRSIGFPEENIESGLPVNTPIWVLCPMADGADIFAAVTAQKAYTEEMKNLPPGTPEREVRFVAPLATPWSRRKLKNTQPTTSYNAESGAFKRIREGGGEKKIGYREFVLPLGGRQILQHHTTFPTPFEKWAEELFAGSHDVVNDGSGAPDLSNAGRDPKRNRLRWDELESKEIDKLLDAEFCKPGDKPRTGEHWQYHAGSLYVSLYSHVLIALWDGILRDKSVGTDAAVRIKIQGPPPEDVSHRPIFNWADAGPVIQIFANNPERIGAGDAPADPLPDPEQISEALRKPAGSEVDLSGKYAVIHPDDCRSASTGVKEDEGRNIFMRIMKARLRFNRDGDAALGGDGYFNPQYDDAVFNSPSENGAAPHEWFDRKLRCVQQMGARVSQLSGDLKTSTLRLFSALFCLVALSAVCFDVYAHNYAGISPGGHPEHHWWMLVVFLGLVGFAATLYWRKLHSPSMEGRYLEYRSLAEAVRIQLVWVAAGIPQSVPLHYLQRHRGAFDWIRNTVSAWCFPYEDGQRRFDTLRPCAKISRLRALLDGWVLDQEGFFSRESGRERRRHHTLHLLGTATALVGICASIFIAAQDIKWHATGDLLNTYFPAAVFSAGILCGLIALMKALPSTHEDSVGIARSRGSGKWIRNFGIAALVCPFVAALLSNGYKTGGKSAFDPSGLCHPVVFYIVLSVNLIGVLAFLAIRFSTEDKNKHGTLPFIPFAVVTSSLLVFGLGSIFLPVHHAVVEYHVPCILLIGLPILFGALLVAWGEKMLHSEHANRYFTAGELFRLTARRLDSVIGKAENATNPDDASQHIAEAQDILFELGKEALSENAEWLLLHRARPLEFPFAG